MNHYIKMTHLGQKQLHLCKGATWENISLKSKIHIYKTCYVYVEEIIYITLVKYFTNSVYILAEYLLTNNYVSLVSLEEENKSMLILLTIDLGHGLFSLITLYY